MVEPRRVQLRRTEGWRKPEGVVVVARPSRWGNPYRVGETQVRIPALDGSAWEHEGRLYKASGQRHAWNHSDGSYTWHRVELATSEQVVALYERWLAEHPALVKAARRELAGRDLGCWCSAAAACHADVLLRVANGGDPVVRLDT